MLRNCMWLMIGVGIGWLKCAYDKMERGVIPADEFTLSASVVVTLVIPIVLGVAAARWALKDRF